MAYLSPLEAQRLQRGAQHLRRLGDRAIEGFILDLADRIGGLPAALHLLAEYERRLTPAMIFAAGGSRPRPRALRAVPPELRA